LSRLRLRSQAAMATFARRVVRQHLAVEEDLVAAALDGFANHLLGAAIRIHFGGIDQGKAEIEPEPKSGHLVSSLVGIVAHPDGALPERRDRSAGRQAQRL
jgi:hypothetical protein